MASEQLPGFPFKGTIGFYDKVPFKGPATKKKCSRRAWASDLGGVSG